MSYAIATLVQSARHLLDDNPWTDALTNSPANGTATGYSVADTTLYDKGNVLETDDGDLALVTALASATSLTVRRSVYGATGAAHTSGDVLTKDPVFRYVQIKEAMTRVIDNLWPHVWKVGTYTVTPDSTSQWFDLASGGTALDLVGAVQQYGVSPTVRLGQYGTGRIKGGLPIEFSRNLGSMTTSGVGVRFPAQFYHSTNTITVYTREKITSTISTTNYSDVVSGIMADMVVMGACARLVAGKEIPRVTQEDVTMGDASVVPTRRLSAAAWYQGEFTRLRNDYAEELRLTSRKLRTVDA